MAMKKKFLMLLVFVILIAVFVITHVAGHLAFVIENFFAFALPMLNLVGTGRF